MQHPGGFDINVDRVYCTACKTVVSDRPQDCNPTSLHTHYTKSKKCAAARARRRAGMAKHLAPPAHNPEADAARALLHNRRRDCMAYHWPTVRIDGNAYEEPIDLPISLLWDEGLGHGTAGGQDWHTTRGQRFSWATGQAQADGEIELAEHVGAVYSTNRCLKKAVRGNEEPDGTNCCVNCRGVVNNKDVKRLLLRLRKSAGTAAHPCHNSRHRSAAITSAKLKSAKADAK